MKQSFSLAKSKLFLVLCTLLMGASPTWADELTVCDGTATSTTVPLYGSYVDTQGCVSEFIIPKATLEDIDGATLSAMKFYISSHASKSWGSAQFEVYVKEVEATGYTGTTANTEGTNTIVYTGSLDGQQSTMEIPFASNYTYQGGNLLVGIKVTTAGTWVAATFIGINATGYPAFHYGGSYSNGRDNFLPKVTFTYTPASGVLSRPKDVTASDVAAKSATISWTAGATETSWEIAYSTENTKPAEDGSYLSASSTSYNLTGLHPETAYYVFVRAIEDTKHSKWSDVATFTTLVACVKPTTLSASDIGSDAATISWMAGAEGQDSWEIEYSTSSDFANSTVVDVTEATKVLTGLTSATTYYVRVRANCGGGDYSSWTDAISFTTLQVAVPAANYSDDFESACNWLLVNGNLTNAWAWGEAISNGGSKSLYISNDSGASYAYSPGAGETMVFAKKLFSFDEGTYTFAYDWNGKGEGGYDYLRVALVPASVKLIAGTSVPSGFSASTLPTDWIALDGATKLNGVDIWQKKSVEVAVAEGAYNVVFVWRNDGSYGTSPAAAIDNFSITKLAAPTPTGLCVSDITAHEATLTWAATENTWEVYQSISSEAPDANVTVTGTTDTNSYTFTGLKGETNYYVWVRSVSGENKSEWAGTNFTTLVSCIAPTALTINSITDKSATISWTKGAEEQTQWEVSYSTTSGAPNEGTIVPVTETTYEMTGLTNETPYYVYVRAVNAEDDKSQWSDVLTVIPGMFTVNEGTQTNGVIPIYGYNVDNNLVQSQFIIPATTLAGMGESEISKLAFYCTSETKSWGNATFDVYLSETENTEFATAATADWTAMTKVYGGKLSVSGYQMVVTFNEPFSYNGGNLMIGFKQTLKGTYSSSNWYGVTTTNYPAVGGQSSVTRYQFLPKISFYFAPISDEAVLAVSTESLSFGNVKPTATDEQKQLTFTIQNKGKAALTGVNVNYTGDAAISVSSVENATIKAKDDAEYADITVTVNIDNATPGDYSGTITVSAEGQANAVVAVSGTALDANKMFEDFAGKALPTDWETVGVGSHTTGSYASSYSWNFANGYARYYSAPSTAGSLDDYKHSLVSPYMEFADGGEKVSFRMKKETQYAGYISYLLVQYATDGSTWTATEEGAFANANIPEEWTDVEVTIPATAKRIRFVATGIAIDDIYGGKLQTGARFAIDTDGTTQNFDFVKQNTTAQKTYTITNNGDADLTVSFTVPEGFNIAEGNSLTVPAGESGLFTISMNTITTGAKSGDVTLVFEAIGQTSYTIPVSGYVLEDGILVDFADNLLPEGWTKSSSMSIYSNEIYTNSYVQSLTSPSITVAEGEKLMIYARGTATAKAEMNVQTSTDNGTTWTTVKTFKDELRTGTSNKVILYVDNIAAGNYKLRFYGDFFAISIINGYTYNQDAPALGVTLAGTNITTGYNDNFGTKVKAQPEAHTYTIKNTGTGTLTGTITSSVPAHFTVSESAFSLAKDETLDFDLNLVFDDNYEDKASVITIHPTVTGLADIVINASATTKDPNIWEEDFENGIPQFWVNEGGAWSTTRYNHEGQAGPMSSSTKTLTTPRLQAIAGQVLKFDVIDAESSTYFMKAEYSSDNEDWTEIETYTTSGTKEFTAPADGYYYLRFTGYYTYLDNLNGFKLAVPDHIMVITASNIPTSGLKATKSFTATVTVKESRGVAETGVVAKLYMGTEIIGTSESTDFDANASKSISIICTPTADGNDVEMHIEVEYAGGTLRTAHVTRDVAALTYLTLDETSSDAITAGTYDNVTLKRSFNAGWNTVCLPFTVSDVEGFFGTGAKVYNFTSFTDGNLGFTSVTTLDASYPYIVYVPTAITDDIALTNITIASGDASPWYRYQSSAYFRGTYAPIASGDWTKNAQDDVIYGVTSDGKIQKAGASAMIKGFRAYFDLPAGSNARLAIYDEVTGITTILDAKELNNDGKVYNLNGQRVENAHKGLYIINGKKVNVK